MTGWRLFSRVCEPQQRPHAARPGDEDEVVRLRLGHLGEIGGDLALMERAGQGFEQGRIALLPLHLEGFNQKLPGTEVVQHEVEEVDVVDPQPRRLLRDLAEQEGDVFAHPEFVFRRVVEDVEGDLVADAGAAQELVGDDPRQDLVQAFGQRCHGDTCMQRRTYSSSWASRTFSTGWATWTVCSRRVRVPSM
jgi:hypothetical protein